MSGSIETIQFDQLDTLYEIETAAHLVPWPWPSFCRCFERGYLGRCYRLDGELAGFYWAMVGVDDIQLLNLAVDPAKQNNGIGAALLQDLIVRTEALGKEQLFLEVRESNASAIALYRKYGFCDVGQRVDYYPMPFGGRETAIVMAKQMLNAE